MVLQLKKYSIDFIPTVLKKKLLKYKYAFNASYVEYRGIHYLALRVFDAETETILAFIFYWCNEKEINEIDLSLELKNRLGVFKVADPKLFIMDNNVWGSFNTGHVLDGNNELGIFELNKSKITQSYICSYKKRSRIEKNWSFFSHNDEIYSLYNVNPFTILKGEINRNNEIEFKDYLIDEKTSFVNYSIGTPLLKSNNKYLFIGHYKIIRKGKMIYFGKPFTLVFNENPSLKIGNSFLFHSIKSLFGNKKKFNPKLLSCTYFSGIFKKNNKIYLGYGVNDITWNIATLIEKKLWR